MNEIPVAERVANPEKKTSRISNNAIFIIFILGSSLISFAAIGWFLSVNGNQQATQNNSQTTTLNDNSNDTPPETVIPPKNDLEEIKEPIPENVLGHLPYEQAPVEELKAITSDGSIRLRNTAADKFLQMQQEAQRQGIILTPISGFRTVSQQEYLFFDIKAQRNQDTSKRAEVSAPPGYSEHHTGYAIDIGDGNAPATNLSPSFEQTAAYKWLVKNAPKYSFELSFPKDNLQGINYEPWHWRYVGDTDSLETFYKVQQLKTNLQQQ